MVIFTKGALTSVLEYRFMHLSQLLTHCSESEVIPGQKNLSVISQFYLYLSDPCHCGDPIGFAQYKKMVILTVFRLTL